MNLEKLDILKHASTQMKLHARLKDIFHSWPNLKEATFKFLDFIHPDIKDDVTGHSLLSICLNNACDQYDNCPAHDVGTIEQVYLYLYGLLQESHKILDVHVTTKDLQIWDPLNQSILNFLTNHTDIKLVQESYINTKPETIRMMFLSRIITVKDLKAIPGNKIKEIINNAALVPH